MPLLRTSRCRERQARGLQREKIVRSAVNGGAGNNVVAATRNVEYAEKACRLSGRREHCGGAALHLANLFGNVIVGRILQTGIKISALLQIEQLRHIFAGVVFESSALNDGNLSGLAVARRIASLNADGFDFAHCVLLADAGPLVCGLSPRLSACCIPFLCGRVFWTPLSALWSRVCRAIPCRGKVPVRL